MLFKRFKELNDSIHIWESKGATMLEALVPGRDAQHEHEHPNIAIHRCRYKLIKQIRKKKGVDEEWLDFQTAACTGHSRSVEDLGEGGGFRKLSR